MQTLAAVLLFLAALSPVFARELSTQKDIYSTLDVQATLRVARGEVVQPAKEETLEIKPWSIPLVHRDAMKGNSNKNNELSYAERMQQRLKRDAARVAAINSRLELAVNGIKRSSLKPDSASSFTMAESDFQSPVVSGMDQGSGEYFSRIGVGAPRRDQLMVLDTGSDVTWIQCEPCSDCYQQSDPIYNPALSSSYKLVGCQANLCQQLDVSGCSRNGSCLYQVSYGDGSYTQGNFATETLTLGGAPVQNVAIGCGHDNEGLFVGAAGLLGLGGGSLSFPSQLTDENGKIFSYCLVDRDSESSSTLQFGRAAVPNGAVLAPMLKNSRLDTFYYVSLSGISVGGKMLSISDSVFGIDASGNGGVIVDSGTAVTRLQTAAYDSLRDAFRAGTKNLPSTDGVSLFDTCYDLSSKESGGTCVWQARTGGPIFSGPCISPAISSQVIVGSRDGLVYAFDLRKGNCLWKHLIGEPITSSVYVDETIQFLLQHENQPDTIYRLVCVCSTSGTIYILKVDSDAANRHNLVYSERFSSLEEAHNVSISNSNLTHTKGHTENHGLKFFRTDIINNSEDQEPNVQFMLCHEYAKLELPGEIFSSPIMVGGRIFVGCRDDHVYCIDIDH